MNDFEKALLGILEAVPATTTVFVHSAQGLAVVNASETLLASILQQFAPPATNPPSVS